MRGITRRFDFVRCYIYMSTMIPLVYLLDADGQASLKRELIIC